MTRWGTPVEQERRKRIRLAVAAYAYECHDDPVMTDSAFDALAESVDRTVATGDAVLDRFFSEEFSPMTGMWVRDHPGITGIEKLYREHYRK